MPAPIPSTRNGNIPCSSLRAHARRSMEIQMIKMLEVIANEPITKNEIPRTKRKTMTQLNLSIVYTSTAPVLAPCCVTEETCLPTSYLVCVRWSSTGGSLIRTQVARIWHSPISMLSQKLRRSVLIDLKYCLCTSRRPHRY